MMHHLADYLCNKLKQFISFSVGMMFVGDLLQLQPVKGRFIFEKPKDLAHAAFFEDKSLWHSLETVTLNHNHRQGEGSNWTQTLNRMRIGEPSEEDLVLLKSRCINKLSKNYPHEACHLSYTNKEVNDINNVQKITN